MFELPHSKRYHSIPDPITKCGTNERRVRRSDLNSSSGESTPDPELQQLFLERLSSREEKPSDTQSLLPDDSALRDGAQAIQGINEHEEGLEFRLFAPSSTQAGGNISRIRIKSPEPGNLVLISQRPNSYYFASELNSSQKLKLASSAISGEEVLLRSHTLWPGCYRPWRVITFKSSGKILRRLGEHAVAVLDEDDVQRKRKRKGKKARIAIRRKLVASKERMEKAAKDKTEKEVQEKIKRAKRNREKKIKQRERNKRKKAGDIGSAEISFGPSS